MVALTFLASLAFLATSGFAAPTTDSLRILHLDPRKVLCQLPILKKYLCPRDGHDDLTRKTNFGIAQGTQDPSGASRFIVKYADSQRWKPSTLASSWELPTGSPNVTVMPLACPQPFADASAYTEDCLSMILYVPPSVRPSSSVPTFMWIHGGSFILGSASAAGLDGSSLAIATNSIVAVVQYRLGALGFMAPDGTTNLAVKDLVNALQFLNKALPAFGGDPGKITIAGQSSGAALVRSLLAVPSASSLFSYAIIQSDPMNFGFLKPSVQQSLQSMFNGLIDCTTTDTTCQDSLSLDDILNNEMVLFGTAWQSIPVVGQSEPMRPVLDGSFITTSLDSTTPFPSVSKPVLISTVVEEAGYAIYMSNPSLTQSDLTNACNGTFGPERTNVILSSGFYPPADDARVQLQAIGTDYLWRCSSWTFARNWASHGGTAYVGEYVIGATYPGNEVVPYCTQPGIVCHQDDIEIVFGSVSNPSPAQSALVSEMQTRYRAFLNTGNPNTPNLPNWPKAGTSSVNAIQLGAPGSITVGACEPSFWGQAVQYDYQFYANA
ncbi:Crystal protein [Leucoagaricus sp. SymC.cos]|nr:Crystal protein [Leucoagaricus sp. SymC.cos]